ncbi:hypothetical protein CEK62_04100 [Alcanivorax sp. N3-2A]|nr:hypothetical protein CEK62_04100 [Alcanivorax sp. N3-2A]
MARGKHPKAVIEQAIQHAESEGWTVRKPGKSAHAWGILECPNNDPECRCGKFCRNGVWSTPRNPDAHASSIRKWVNRCKYANRGEE